MKSPHAPDELTPTGDRQFPALGISGTQLLDAFRHASQVISDHREQLNALNVFPVPDGDTGTNMALTMKSAIDAADKRSGANLPTAEVVAGRLAHGALMGARGNSGVILSQILRGFSNAVVGCDQLLADDIVRALDSASALAYDAVIKPVEGTMLTVIGDAAKSARIAFEESADVYAVIDAAADGASTSLAHTPELLELLRQAQVVDAGGQGVAYILRAIANHLRGNFGDIQIGELLPKPALQNLREAGEEHRFDDSGYCTNFAILGAQIDLDSLRAEFDRFGTSVVVIGDANLLKIHVHTDRPDQALALGMTFGSLDRVSIDNMDRQIQEVASNLARHSRSTVHTADIEGTHAIVACTEGEGLARALLSVGATTVIEILQSSPPSIDLILRAVETADSGDVLFLPNDSRLLQLARGLPALTGKRVTIVPTTSFAEGLVALGAMSLTSNIDTNTRRMTTVLKSVCSIELAIADLDAKAGQGKIPAGAVNLYVNGTFISVALDLGLALTTGFETIGPISPDLCTLFAGSAATIEDRDTIRDLLERAFPESEIEVVDGGQAYHRFIIVFE